jgi:hypothetical protein
VRVAPRLTQRSRFTNTLQNPRMLWGTGAMLAQCTHSARLSADRAVRDVRYHNQTTRRDLKRKKHGKKGIVT